MGELGGYGNEYLRNHRAGSREERSKEYQMDIICQSNRQQGEYQDKEIDKDNLFPLIQIT